MIDPHPSFSLKATAYRLEGATKSDVINPITTGNGLGLVNYRGHGWWEAWVDPPGIDWFTADDVRGLQNPGWFPIVYNVCCSNGCITAWVEVMVEAWTRHSDGGGVGSLGASRPSAHFSNNIFDEELCEATINGAMDIGGAVNYAKAAMLMHYQGTDTFSYALSNARQYYWIGDPGITIWDDLPRPIIVSHLHTITTDPVDFPVGVFAVEPEGEPIAYARVYLYKENDLQRVWHTGADG